MAVPATEWLPEVWNGAPGTTPDLDDPAEYTLLLDRLLGHYNAVARDLKRGPGHYGPLFSHDERDGCIWELWADGFGRAVGLRPDHWDKVFNDDSALDVRDAARLLAALVVDATVLPGKAPEIPRELRDDAPSLIPEVVEELYAYRLRHDPSPRDAAKPSGAKIGRNEPCPCGSGWKFKKCCGA